MAWSWVQAESQFDPQCWLGLAQARVAAEADPKQDRQCQSGLAAFCAAGSPVLASLLAQGGLIAQRRPDLVLVDGRLPWPDVLKVVKQVGQLAPPVRRMVLVAEAGASEDMAAVGAELLWIGDDPTARLLRALAEVAQAAGGNGRLRTP